ncbi:hypothetical protein BUALT_Bualt03G0070300 [Buddleja alternifolia]|uniref:Uncharacterized protein n=1 Tax=Buddleja alternifolia TaxID=168488 RepID=A0AAV6Y2Z5_9LAMI|nr:hypothetical protein BUALT_Bualt03G0070300 [Buddleja alternifolia]
MASCISFSRLFLLPCRPLDTRTEFAVKTRKIFMSNEPFRATTYVCTGVKVQKWSNNADQDMATSTELPHNLSGHTVACNRDELVGGIEDVKQLLLSKANLDDPIESLVMVDAIERLGISSYFQQEIETILRQQYIATTPSVYGSYTLHHFSLFFRLLRQHGHYISADVFNNFKDKDGSFRRELRQDMRGLMELYEAAQLSLPGEDILDEAAAFSSKLILHGCSMTHHNCSTIMVTNRLRHPHHKSIAKLTEKDFLLEDLKGMYEWEIPLRELVVMDLRKGQLVYQKEFLQVSEWWNELGIAENLQLARNQPLKWYTWSMAILLDDISLSAQRVELTKSIAFIYLIDDIFDLYGTLDELTIFTEAINKWDYAAIDTLPDYMKMCYRALLDVTNEIGHKIYKRHGYDPIDSLKTTWASLCNAYLVEAKWFASGDLPTAEEYLENGKVSSGVDVAMVHMFFLLGLGETNGGVIHLNDTSKLMSSVATILRLWNDLGSAKDEHQDGGKDGSYYIECYMKDHLGLPLAQAREHVVDMIANEWKSLNKECFRLNHPGASSFKRASLNLARIVSLMYSYDDNHRLPVLEEYVKFMLFNETT